MAKKPEPQSEEIIQICPIPSNIRVTGHYRNNNEDDEFTSIILAIGLKRSGEMVLVSIDSFGQVESEEDLTPPPTYTINWEKNHKPQTEG